MQSGLEECFALAENLDMKEFHDGIIEESGYENLGEKKQPDVEDGLGDEPCEEHNGKAEEDEGSHILESLPPAVGYEATSEEVPWQEP